MKKCVFPFVFFTVFSALLFGCKGSFEQTRNDLSTDGKIGKSIFRAGQMTGEWFQQFKMYAFQSIGEDEDLNEQEKKLESRRIEDMQFRENSILFFTMVNNVPMLEDERPQSFSVVDSKGNNFLTSTDLVKLKITEISQYGSRKSYNYTYILHTEEIDIDNFSKDNLPVTLSANFPDNKKIEYTLE